MFLHSSYNYAYGIVTSPRLFLPHSNNFTINWMTFIHYHTQRRAYESRDELCCRHGWPNGWQNKYYLHTYLLTAWSRVLLEKLTGCHLLKKYLAFHRNRRFITAFTNALRLSLSKKNKYLKEVFCFCGYSVSTIWTSKENSINNSNIFQFVISVRGGPCVTHPGAESSMYATYQVTIQSHLLP
jgi:hypothetical protein